MITHSFLLIDYVHINATVSNDEKVFSAVIMMII